jgi:hypothetical protein
MKNAIAAVAVLSTFAACSTPAEPGNGGTGGQGTGGTSGGAGGTGGSVGGAAPAAGTTGMSVGGAGGTTGGVGGASGASGTTNVAGTPGVGGAAGTGAVAAGGMPGTGGVSVGGGAGVATSGGMSGSDATGGMAGSTSGAAGAAAGGMAGSAGQAACAPPTVTLTGNDAVDGTLITFNDNGGWCWYQDERVVVDTARSKLIIGSVASGGNRNGNVEAVVYDLAAKTVGQPTVLGNLSVDDHNAPAFAIAGDGNVAAMWAGHRIDCNSYYSVYNGTSWAAKKQHAWSGCPWDNDNTHMVTYSNLWYLSAESRLLSGVRSVSTSPNLLTSTDNGASYSYYGRLSSTPTMGYVAGYYKYWGNGTDRIDFVGTEAHPRDNDNNLWHGYIKGGKTYNSAGTVVDETLGDSSAPNVDKFTKLFSTGGTVGKVKISHAWNSDLVRYADGTVALIWTGRADTTTSTDTPDLRLLYARYDGSTWKTTYLDKAGPKLYSSEQDYTGLGALDPDDPTTIYISSPIDPRDDATNVGKREIWRGTTCDNGVTFTWTPVTSKSTKDNFRPVVPKWDASHTALLWIRGTYTSAQSYDSDVVGIISGP